MRCGARLSDERAVTYLWPVVCTYTMVRCLVHLPAGITANSNYRRAMNEGKRMPGKYIQVRCVCGLQQ